MLGKCVRLLRYPNVSSIAFPLSLYIPKIKRLRVFQHRILGMPMTLLNRDTELLLRHPQCCNLGLHRGGSVGPYLKPMGHRPTRLPPGESLHRLVLHKSARHSTQHLGRECLCCFGPWRRSRSSKRLTLDDIDLMQIV